MKQVTLFLVLLFGITWTLGFLWRPQPPIESLWEALAPFLPVVWAPTIIALILTGMSEGAAGLRNELRRLRYVRGTSQYLVLAAAVPLFAMLIALFIARAAGYAAPFISSEAILVAIGVQVITGAVGEELGWRGFLLPRLGKRFGTKMAGWVMGTLWSLWHIPAWFNPALPHPTMPVLATLLFIVFFGVFLAFVFNGAGGSVLATIVAHLSLNITSAMGGVRLSSHLFWWTLAGIFGLAALVVTIASSTRSPAGVHVLTND